MKKLVRSVTLTVAVAVLSAGAVAPATMKATHRLATAHVSVLGDFFRSLWDFVVGDPATPPPDGGAAQGDDDGDHSGRLPVGG